MESSEQEGRRLILSGYSDQFIKMANSCTTWLFWHVPFEGYKRKILNSGTVFFVDLGDGPFGVTAAHVIDRLNRDKKKASDLVCELGNLQIDPSNRLLAYSYSQDIATFKIAEKELADLNIGYHRDPGPWPPRVPQEGKGAFFGGFRLGKEKELDLRIPYPFDFWNGFGPLTGIYENKFSIHFEREYWVKRHGRMEPPYGAEWGGVSGGPLFALFENPVVFYQLIGIISEYQEKIELLIAKSAKHISKSGEICA